MKKLCIVFLLLCIALPTQVFANEGSLYGRVVILDAGHGIGAPGGGRILSAGYFEHERMFLLAGFIYDELLNRGATVHMTRTCPMDVALPVRPTMMNRWSVEALLGDRFSRLKKRSTQTHEKHMLIEEIDQLLASLELLDRIIYNHPVYAPIYINYPFDYGLQTQIHPSWQKIFEFQSDPLIRYNWLAISLHSNGTTSPFASGADVFFAGNNNPRNRRYFANYSHEDITELFGHMLLDGIAQLGIRPNRVRVHHFMVIRETNLPAVLAENGYHTNEQDRRLLQDDDFMRRLAIVYANTIEEYFAHINRYRQQYYENLPSTRKTSAWLSHIGAVRQRARLLINSPNKADSYTAHIYYLLQYKF